jgi:undecaprenyl phosphate-alpha-L-ara4N flippase subunit ArnE
VNTKRLSLKIFLLLISSDILETLVHFFFKKSALPQAGFVITSLGQALLFAKQCISSAYLWLGIFSVLIIFAIWTTVLSRIELSVAVPIASFSYILIPIVSIIFLGEKVAFLRWIGILLILGGVICVSLTGGEKEKNI